MNFKPLSNPLLIVGDNPALSGGLSRICRDLATLCCTMPQFRVAVLGRGIGNRRKFPFLLYDYPESGQWGEDYIQQVWEDFACNDYGIILTTDDPSRRHWFANPVGLPIDLACFLGESRTFQKWGYFPIDSTGPNPERLSLAARDCLSRYDRVLTASEWGCNLVRAGGTEANWLPHGIFTKTFRVRPRQDRELLDWGQHHIVVGSVMANQARKDYPNLFDIILRLKEEYGTLFRAWLHTDRLIGYWNIPALAADYGVGDCLEVTMGLNDDQLALRYSSCDCTVLPSHGEGFGYPIAESLSCGTAAVVTGYGAGSDLVAAGCTVGPRWYRIDTAHNVRRAVIYGGDFKTQIMEQIARKAEDWDHRGRELSATVEHLDWENLKHPWKRWLLEGLQ